MKNSKFPVVPVVVGVGVLGALYLLTRKSDKSKAQDFAAALLEQEKTARTMQGAYTSDLLPSGAPQGSTMTLPGGGPPIASIPTETGTPGANLMTLTRGNRFTVQGPQGLVQYVATAARDTSGPEPMYPAVNLTTGAAERVPLTSIFRVE